MPAAKYGPEESRFHISIRKDERYTLSLTAVKRETAHAGLSCSHAPLGRSA